MEKKVTIGDREVTLKEMKYLDAVELGTQESGKENVKMLLLSATDLTEEEVINLSFKDGVKLQKEVNDFNGLTDFQQTTTG